jgi:hypothetical protein
MMYFTANLEMEEPEESLNTLKLCSPEEFTRLCREKTQEVLSFVVEIETPNQLFILKTIS